MRILVVEDDAGIGGGLQATLRQRGHAVDWVTRAQAAWQALCTESVDAVVLDLGLPDGDGGEWLHRLRAQPPGALPDPSTAVLIITARDQVGQRIAGLDLGADDYLGKPFDIDELEARLRAVARRRAGRATARLRHGDLCLDPATREVTRAGQPVELSPREFIMLQLLLEAGGRVLSRQQLEERMYGWNEAIASNAVQVHVHHLRRKLGEDLIQTLRGVGYFIPATDGSSPDAA